MSAIFGIWKLSGGSINGDHACKMKDILTPYGLDAQDTYIEGNIVLGSCLNKISIYSQKDIPIHSEQNGQIVLVADAQIYNRDELIYDYKLTDHKDISNNELIRAAYEKWGEDCPKYINGDFAFAIWENNKLIVVRDHLGVRPLYYYYNEAIFVFATDYRAILALPFVPKGVNEKMLYNILINHDILRKENTHFEGIYSLLPSHTLKIGKDGITLKKYWTPGSGKKIIYNTEEEYFKALYDMVSKAIKIRITNTNVKIGGQLSGGLDSAVIDILANRELKKENKELSALFTWAPSFEVYERQERDERKFIEQICEREGFECTYFDIGQALATDDIDKIKAVDAGQLFAMTHEVESVSSKDIRLMLSGWGGDQGISHGANLFELFVHREWRYYFKEIRSLSQGSSFRFLKLIISSTVLSLLSHLGYLSFNKNDLVHIDNKDFRKSMKKYKTRTIKYSAIDPVKRMESGEIQIRTEISAWLGADYNVQYLFPFLDYHLVDFAMSTPRHMFYKNRVNRYIFRKTFEEILPKDLCYYIPKDDIARCTYRKSKINDIEKANKLLEKKLSKTMFSRYLDFNKTRELISRLKKKENIPQEHRLRMLLEFFYNIQKLIAAAEK